jgi:pyruvate dehydrogenase E1 component alpha subunit
MGAHTTADDAGRYRDEADLEEWRRRDPVDRVRRHLQAADAWSQEWEDATTMAAVAEIEAAVARAETLEPFGPGAAFDRVFARPTADLEAQRAAMLRDHRGGS